MPNVANYVMVSETLADHPKTTRAMRTLRISRMQVIGHLVVLWSWALKNAPDGDLYRFTIRDISDAARFTDPDDMDQTTDQKAEEFVLALVECRTSPEGAGFLIRTADSFSIHDWQDYGGKLQEKRKIIAAKVAAHRARKEETDGNHYVTVTGEDSNGYPLRREEETRGEEIRGDKTRQDRQESQENLSDTPNASRSSEASRRLSVSPDRDKEKETGETNATTHVSGELPQSILPQSIEKELESCPAHWREALVKERGESKEPIRNVERWALRVLGNWRNGDGTPVVSAPVVEPRKGPLVSTLAGNPEHQEWKHRNKLRAEAKAAGLPPPFAPPPSRFTRMTPQEMSPEAPVALSEEEAK